MSVIYLTLQTHSMRLGSAADADLLHKSHKSDLPIKLHFYLIVEVKKKKHRTRVCSWCEAAALGN